MQPSTYTGITAISNRKRRKTYQTVELMVSREERLLRFSLETHGHTHAHTHWHALLLLCVYFYVNDFLHSIYRLNVLLTSGSAEKQFNTTYKVSAFLIPSVKYFLQINIYM